MPLFAEPLFKPGDTAIVRPDIDPGDKYDIYVNPEMAEKAGQKVHITMIRNRNPITYSIEDDPHAWTEDLLLPKEQFQQNCAAPTEDEFLKILLG